MNVDDSTPPPGGAASLKQRAYVELKDRIVTGALPPGTLLSERQLARSLKMSKTPVHAALERLEGDGLVTVAAQQGIIVRSLAPQDVADHYEIREALESFVVGRLAGRLTAEQASRLQRNLGENRRAVEAATSRPTSGSTPSSTSCSASSTATPRSPAPSAGSATRSTA